MDSGLIHLPALAVAAFVALLMLRAAVHKAVDLARFEGVLDDYGLVPAPLLKVVRAMAPALEILAAALLASGIAATAGAVLAAALLVAYAGAMGANLLRGRTEIDCGCGGPGQPIGWALAARNLVLAAALIPAGLGLATPRSVSEGLAAWAVGIAAIAVWIAAEQLSANAARMRRDRQTLLASAFGAAS